MNGPNLRGWTAVAVVDNKACLVKIVTHIRNDIWMVEGSELPIRYRRAGRRRTTVARSAIALLHGPESGEMAK